MELWANETERPMVISAKVSKAERDKLEDMRRGLRLRSNGEVMRMALALLDGMMEMGKLMPPSQDEQKRLLATMSAFAENIPEGLSDQQVFDTISVEVERTLRSGGK